MTNISIHGNSKISKYRQREFAFLHSLLFFPKFLFLTTFCVMMIDDSTTLWDCLNQLSISYKVSKSSVISHLRKPFTNEEMERLLRHCQKYFHKQNPILFDSKLPKKIKAEYFKKRDQYYRLYVERFNLEDASFSEHNIGYFRQLATPIIPNNTPQFLATYTCTGYRLVVCVTANVRSVSAHYLHVYTVHFPQ